jgi:hypothetical protein
MELENVTLSEIGQLQKDKCSMFSLVYGRWQVDFIKVDNRVMVIRAWEGYGGRKMMNPYRDEVG